MSAGHEQAQQERAVATYLARHAADRVARRVVPPALTKAGAALGAKLGIALAAVLLVVLLLGALVGAVGAAFQHTTAPWPVRPGAGEGAYLAGGWAISSRYGWRDDPVTGVASFHDGIDIVNPSGGCPFGQRCPLPAMFDGVVTYVGWDQSGADDPETAGGGQVVIMENGDGDHEVLYAHLEPYRVTVQLQGRVVDPYGRYDAYDAYAPIGDGERTPGPGDAAIEMWCAHDMPTFQPARTGGGTVTFTYDRPAQCRTTVRWGQRGDGWEGWTADEPPADAAGEATLAWETPLWGERGDRRAGDVGLRFRAHLVPPPPPPTATPATTPLPEPPAPAVPQADRHTRAIAGQGSTGRGSNAPGASAAGPPRVCRAEGVGTRCVWALADIPLAQASAARRGPERASVHAPGVGGVARTSLAAATPTAAPEPALAVVVSGQPLHAPVGGRVSVAVSVFAGAAAPASIPVSVAGSAAITVLDARASSGACAPRGAEATCTVTASAGAPATIWLTIEILPGAPRRGQIPVRATAEHGQRRASDQVVVAVDNYVVTPGPWPPPTQPPLATATATAEALPPAATPLPTAGPPPGGGPGGEPMCAPRALVQLPGVAGASGATGMMRLQADAASSFAAVRAELLAATGRDALARLADALRTPEFRTDKPGVARQSWHMAGRAIDLDQGGAWRLARDGRLTRVWLGATDVTAIFERHGWNRIPPSEGVVEWWHYEYRADGVSWAGAMLQVWPVARLSAAFPDVAWAAAGCQGGGVPVGPSPADAEVCVPGAPSFAGAVEEVSGCGPPVRPGDRVFQLESPLGFVGVTGQTTGPHLHLGLKVRSFDGMYHQTDICTPAWLDGRTASPDTLCWTEMADPLAFLPLAPGSGAQAAAAGATAVIPEGAPYQLPPDYPGSLYRAPRQGDGPAGQYWSPFPDGGRYGGGGALDWLRDITCGTWEGFPWCAPATR